MRLGKVPVDPPGMLGLMVAPTGEVIGGGPFMGRKTLERWVRHAGEKLMPSQKKKQKRVTVTGSGGESVS